MALDHHIDLTIRPSPEFTPPVVMSALFGRLHRMLVARGGEAQREDPIAVAFPGWHSGRRPTLGTVLRLLGSAAALDAAMARRWLGGAVEGSVSTGLLLRVPDGAGTGTLRRVQAKSGVDRLRRRRMKRHGIDAAEAARQIPDEAAEYLDLPYAQLHSLSTGQPFRLMLRQSDGDGTVRHGAFNAYGLSSTATIPRF